MMATWIRSYTMPLLTETRDHILDLKVHSKEQRTLPKEV
jgi:hypothetical protein